MFIAVTIFLIGWILRQVAISSRERRKEYRGLIDKCANECQALRDAVSEISKEEDNQEYEKKRIVVHMQVTKITALLDSESRMLSQPSDYINISEIRRLLQVIDDSPPLVVPPKTSPPATRNIEHARLAEECAVLQSRQERRFAETYYDESMVWWSNVVYGLVLSLSKKSKRFAELLREKYTEIHTYIRNNFR